MTYDERVSAIHRAGDRALLAMLGVLVSSILPTLFLGVIFGGAGAIFGMVGAVPWVAVGGQIVVDWHQREQEHIGGRR